MSDAIPGLDGARRQSVAASLWNAWRSNGSRASLLTGFSGLGKTERVVTPLVERARSAETAAVVIDVPRSPTDLDQELSALLIEALREVGLDELAAEIGAQPNFTQGLRHVLRKPALVVIDEFQRLLAPDPAIPAAPFADQIRSLAQRPGDGGCLWLVSNRIVDPEWSEPFHTEGLEAPSETRDAVSIVLQSIGTEDAEDRIPVTRHDEVARRFGRNPRALRLLGALLRFYDIDELIGAPQAAHGARSSLRLSLE